MDELLDAKTALHRYLQTGRDALLWKLDGASEYDVRRPMTPTSTNARGRVPHWPADRAVVTLHRMLVHVATETHRHAGHADILRETIDGAVGLRADSDNMPDVSGAGDPAAWWGRHRERVERAARDAAGG